MFMIINKPKAIIWLLCISQELWTSDSSTPCYKRSISIRRVSVSMASFVTHSMICGKHISCLVVFEIVLHEIVHTFSYLIDNLDIVQINA